MTKQATKESTEQIIAERRVELAKRMHVEEMGDGFHILKASANQDLKYASWLGPFSTRRSADLFLEQALEENFFPDRFDLRFGNYVIRSLEREARLLEFLEGQGGVSDPRGLARELNDCGPWLEPEDPECYERSN